MSKSEEKTATGDARNQNLQFNKNAQTTYNAAQQDIGDYEGQLGKFAAENPFVQGGQFETAQTQQQADVASSGANAARQAMQSAAVRSGMNPASAIAAGEQVAEANDRNMAARDATATQQRLGLMAGYNQNVLNAAAKPEEMEAQLNAEETGAGNNALGQEVSAAKTPSYLDQLVSGSIAAGDAFAGGYGKAMGCWVAARLWGGWSNSRVSLFRLWLTHHLSRRWYGKLPCWLYRRYGEQAANLWMPAHPWLEAALRSLFECGLRCALRWQNTVSGKRVFREYTRLERKYADEQIDNPKKFSDWAVGFAGRVR